MYWAGRSLCQDVRCHVEPVMKVWLATIPYGGRFKYITMSDLGAASGAITDIH